MRELPFEAGATATTLARAFIITTAAGERHGFTDCDRALELDGVTCRPMDAADHEARTGFDADSGALRSVFDIDLSREAILGGALDGATLEAWRVDWQAPDQRVLVAKGRLGEIALEGEGFEADWLGQATWLDRSTGRVFSRLCDATLGDARCGLSVGEGERCARTFAACKAFGNAANYRGFPYLLGDDVLQAGVHNTPSRDGGSRYGHA